MASKDNIAAQLAATALIGTERAATWPEPGGDLAPSNAAQPAQTTECRFLTSVAAFDVYQRAGHMPSERSQEVPHANAETMPRTAAGAASLLGRVLNGPQAHVLPEYLQLCARSGQRVHERYLPDLLDLAARDEALAPLVTPVLGERGRWLATLNPAWSKLFADSTGGDVWETGSRAQRARLLQRQRASDPNAARTRLEAVWASEPPEERAAFLATLREGLSPLDEPLLEKALDDKRKEVREVAADLLARLPLSALCRRNIDRLKPLVKAKRPMLGKMTVQIELPPDTFKDWARDGLAPKPLLEGLGDRATMLARLIGATPLAFWHEHAGQNAAEIAALTAKSEWRDAILLGLAAASTRQEDAATAKAVATAWLQIEKSPVLPHHDAMLQDLIAVLPGETREALAAPFLANRKALDARALYLLLKASTHAWSHEFSRTFVRTLLDYVNATGGYSGYDAQQLLGDQVALRVDPALAPAANLLAQGAPDVRSNALDKFLATLQCRFDLHKELKP